MSHTGVDVIDFLFYTIYPVIGIFIVEIISRAIKLPKWIKLWTQAVVSVAFGIYYWFILPAPKFSINCNGYVCISNCLGLSRKTSKNFS